MFLLNIHNPSSIPSLSAGGDDFQLNPIAESMFAENKCLSAVNKVFTHTVTWGNCYYEISSGYFWQKKKGQSALKITRSYPKCDSVLANSKFQDLILCKTHSSMYQTTLIMWIPQSNETLWKKCPPWYTYTCTQKQCLSWKADPQTHGCMHKKMNGFVDPYCRLEAFT